MPTSTGKGGGKEGEEERDGGSEGWFDCGGGKGELVDDVLARGESRPDAILSGFPQTEDHSLWPAGLWGWCYTATKRI